VGIGTGIDTYNKAYGKDALNNYVKTIVGGGITVDPNRPPEIMHLVDFDQSHPYNCLNYLKYKFLGIAPSGEYSGSAWVAPFWASLIGWIVSKFHVLPPRFNKPLEGISKGALVVSTIGALALPGSGEHSNSAPTSNPYNFGRNYVYGK
jgi:hypothetical protein